MFVYSLCFLKTSCDTQKTNSRNYIKMNKNPKIVIIGAGAAGVGAATKLYESGFTSITILEAENRIGGRIHSVEFGGSIVDLGGQWVHGENGNLVYDMVKNLDLLSPSYNTYEDMTFYLPDGSVMDKTITNRLFKIGENLIFDESSKDEPGTFGNFFVKRYNEEVLMEFRSNKDILRIANQIQEWFKKFFLCFEAAKSWHDISVKGVFCYTPCDGDQQLNWRNKGFKTIFDVLMRKIPDNKNQIPLEDKILMNKEVNSIIWEDNGSSQSDITITCSDGSVYTADHVIITVSVGVLKENHKKWFRPELPPYKINSIEHITLGNVSKIFLKFPQIWWPNEVKGFSLIWTEEAKVNLKNEVANLEPTINGISWLENVFGFYVIDSHPNVLLGWVTGELSSEVEHLSDEIVMSNCMYLLRKFVGNKYDISEPGEILRSKWSSNPHFCGTYTFSSIEAEQFNAKTEDLACPVSSKNKNSAILFAGESTHSKYYSTVHGAIESGYREANRLIDLYKDFLDCSSATEMLLPIHWNTKKSLEKKHKLKVFGIYYGTGPD